MLYSIPKTRMLSASQDSLSPDSKHKSIWVELLIFLLVASIASWIMSFIQSAVTSVVMVLDPEFQNMYLELITAETLDTQALLDYMNTFMESLPAELYIVFLASSVVYAVAAIIFCKCFEKRSLFSMGFNSRHAAPEYLLGLLVGGAMILLPTLACYLTGSLSFSINQSSSPLIILLFLLAFILQGFGEEVLFRGYLMTSLTRRHSPWVAIIVSAFIFSIFHMPNDSFSIIAFINILLFGIFAGVVMLKRGSIWAVSAIHTAWNFVQGNIFGIRVSGSPAFPSVILSSSADFGSILSGGDFGLEGGLGATALLLVALLIALLMPCKRGELSQSQSQ